MLQNEIKTEDGLEEEIINGDQNDNPNEPKEEPKEEPKRETPNNPAHAIKEFKPETDEDVERVPIHIFDPEGNEVDEKDYFFKGEAPSYFKEISGQPVDREDMIKVFRKVFKAKHGFLFYKDRTKEVYLVIIPIRHATEVGELNDSIKGDFQKHAISFLNEGSVNLDTLQKKLESISNSGTIKIAE